MRGISATVLTCLLVVAIARADAPADPLSSGGFAAPTLEPRPHSGIGGVVVGWVGLGLGVLNLATLPLCALDYYEEHDLRGVCIGTSLALGAAGLAAAVPGLVVGYKRRRAYKAWRMRQQTLGAGPNVGVALAADRVWLSYRQRW